MAKEKRFVKLTTEGQGFGMETAILVDRQTGVHYLLVQSSCGAGLTPLLDEHGAPVIDRDVLENRNPWRTMDD